MGSCIRGRVTGQILALFRPDLLKSFSYRNVKKQKANFVPVSVLSVCGLSPNATLVSAAVQDNGIPILNCSNGVVYAYDPSMSSWIKLCDRWWAEGSDFWQSKQRGNGSAADGIMTTIEDSIAGIPDESAADKKRPTWWSTALTLGHLETRLHATKLLDSPQEYRRALSMYAKKISDEGFRSKAEELVKELYGPVYWYVASSSFILELRKFVQCPQAPRQGRFMESNCSWILEARIAKGRSVGLWYDTRSSWHCSHLTFLWFLS